MRYLTYDTCPEPRRTSRSPTSGHSTRTRPSRGDTRSGAPRTRCEDGARSEGGEERPRDLRGDGHRRRRGRRFSSLLLAEVGEPFPARRDDGAMRGDRLPRQHRHGRVHGNREATAMTRRKDVTDMSTNRISLLAALGVAAALAPRARTDRPLDGAATRPPTHRSGVPRDRWPRTIAGKRVVPEGGAEVQALARPAVPPLRLPLPHRPAHATKPKPPTPSRARSTSAASASRSAAAATGSPTVILESGGGASARAWYSPGAHSREDDARLLLRPRRASGSATLAARRTRYRPRRSSRSSTRCWRGRASRRPTSSEAGPSAASSIACTRSATPPKCVGLVGVDGTPIGLPGEPSWLNPPGQPPIDLIGGPGLPDSYYLAAAGRGARGRAGSGIAAARPADARTGRAERTRRLRGTVVDVAEAGRPAVDVVDPRPRRRRGPRHPDWKLPT